MPRLRLGLRIDCLRLPIRQAIRKAAQLGVQAIHLPAVSDLAPDQLSATGRRELLHLLKSSGLSLAALAFPARHGYSTVDGLEARIDQCKKILTLSYELRAPLVTGALGRIPEDASHPARQTLSDAMTDVGHHADRVGAVFAAETGPESGATLSRFIAALGGVGIRACLDPANLLVKGYDPIQSVRELNHFVVLAHARDAIRDPSGELGREATPGDGDLDWNSYLGALEEIAYRGWLVIRLEQASHAEREVQRAVEFLNRF